MEHLKLPVTGLIIDKSSINEGGTFFRFFNKIPVISETCLAIVLTTADPWLNFSVQSVKLVSP